MIMGAFDRIATENCPMIMESYPRKGGGKVFGVSETPGLAWMRLCCRRWESALRL